MGEGWTGIGLRGGANPIPSLAGASLREGGASGSAASSASVAGVSTLLSRTWLGLGSGLGLEFGFGLGLGFGFGFGLS